MESSTFFVSYSTSPVVALLIMAAFLALPLKLGAHLASAERTGIVWCAATGLIGIAAGYLFGGLLGDAVGGPLAAFIGFVLAIKFMLGTGILGALGLTIVAMGASIAGLMILDKIF